MIVDFISFVIEAAAVYVLGRLRFWKLYPYFYLKLIVVTICYLMPRPYDAAWWSQWWLLFDPLILILMLLAIFEVVVRQAASIGRNEFINTALAAVFVGVSFCGLVLWLLPSKLDRTLDLYIWASRGVHVGMAVGMLVFFVHNELMPFKSFLMNDVHFILVMVLTAAVALSDLTYPYIKTDQEWNVVHYCFQLVYCATLLSWIILTPRVISSQLPAGGA